MKVKQIKTPGCFPYQQYTRRIGGIKFEANIFPDQSGKLIGKLGKLNLIESESNIEGFVDQAEKMAIFYNQLVIFLKDVKKELKRSN